MVLHFLQVWCFWSNDLNHRFEKLTRVDILFFTYFLFWFHHLTLFFFFYKKNISFVFFFNFFSIVLSRSHYLGHRFRGLTWVACPLLSKLHVYHATLSWPVLFFFFLFFLIQFRASKDFFLMLSWWLFHIYLHTWFSIYLIKCLYKPFDSH